MHNSHSPEGHKNEEVDTSLGFEPSDVTSAVGAIGLDANQRHLCPDRARWGDTGRCARN